MEQRNNDTTHMPRKTQTERIQYIPAHPEMPEEMELSRDDRKQMAELIAEYPPTKSNQALTH